MKHKVDIALTVAMIAVPEAGALIWSARAARAARLVSAAEKVRKSEWITEAVSRGVAKRAERQFLGKGATNEGWGRVSADGARKVRGPSPGTYKGSGKPAGNYVRFERKVGDKWHILHQLID